MLSKEKIVGHLLSDMEAYKEDIITLCVNGLTHNQYIYWDAWFRGAEGQDLEKADGGILFDGKKKLYKKKGSLIHLQLDPDKSKEFGHSVFGVYKLSTFIGHYSPFVQMIPSNKVGISLSLDELKDITEIGEQVSTDYQDELD